MKNLTNIFLTSAPARTRLAFGINKNVILKSASNDIKRDKNGVRINKNCYLTFAAVDTAEDNKIIAESVFSYFIIDMTRPEFAVKNFIHQFNQIMEICKAVVPAKNINKVIFDIQKVLQEDIKVFVEIKKTTGKPNAKLTKKIIELQNKVVDGFVEAIAPYTNDKSDLVNLAVVTGPKGNFFDLPREDKGFIAKVGGRKVTLDPKYIRWFEEGKKPEKAEGDDIGDQEEIVDEDDLMMDDDGDLMEDI